MRIVVVDATDTHRFVDAVFDRDEPILAPLVDTADELSELDFLAQATNPRVLAEHRRDPDVMDHALVRGVPNASVINAAYSNPPGKHSGGGRFNSPRQGAWYAGVDLMTALTEVHFHRERRLISQTPDLPDTAFTFRAWLADFRTPMAVLHHDLHPQLLDADISRYGISQAYADQVRAAGAGGIVYPSVRRKKGMCVVSFHAALVQNVRKGKQVTMHWSMRDQQLINESA
jgi:RES domain-containing protein